MDSQARVAKTVFLVTDAQITLANTDQAACGIFYSILEDTGKLEYI